MLVLLGVPFFVGLGGVGYIKILDLLFFVLIAGIFVELVLLLVIYHALII